MEPVPKIFSELPYKRGRELEKQINLLLITAFQDGYDANRILLSRSDARELTEYANYVHKRIIGTMLTVNNLSPIVAYCHPVTGTAVSIEIRPLPMVPDMKNPEPTLLVEYPRKPLTFYEPDAQEQEAKDADEAGQAEASERPSETCPHC